MKTKTEQATERPWRILNKENCLGTHTIFFGQGERADNQICQCNRHANAALIVQAVNEWEALNAVAEAAKFLTTSEEESWAELHEALATLSAIRAKGDK